MFEGQHLDQASLIEIMGFAFQMNPSGKRKFSLEGLVGYIGASIPEGSMKSQDGLNRQPSLQGKDLEP